MNEVYEKLLKCYACFEGSIDFRLRIRRLC